MTRTGFCLYLMIAFLLFAGQAPLLKAQKQTWNWYFGRGAGLSFAGGNPVSLSNGQLNTNEGCASISDTSGQLLFYTNGIRVWDRNHANMPNGFGLNGSSSSSQSTLIVPFPSNPDRFYVFTADQTPGVRGLNYSIVDMQLNGGLGDVIQKNTPLYAPSSERLAGILHANGRDVWVMSQVAMSDSFMAYLVTPTGLSPPVVSRVGHRPVNTFDNIGQIRFASNCKYMVRTLWDTSVVELFDFDNVTGRLSNPVRLDLTVPSFGPYGCEFSPDNTKLYVGGDNLQVDILQFDLTAANVATSGIPVFSSLLAFPGTLQLGPDGKIYVAIVLEDSIDVIHNPNARGAACNYAHKGVPLIAGYSWGGLPNFITSRSKGPDRFGFSWTGDCLPFMTMFSLLDSSGVDSVLWDFGDPMSGAANQSRDFSPGHVFSATGSYTVRLITWVCGTSPDTTEQQVVIVTEPALSLADQYFPCGQDTLWLDAGNPGSQYRWSTGDTTQQIGLRAEDFGYGLFRVTVEVNNACGSARDTTWIQFIPPPDFALPEKVNLCEGDSTSLFVGTASGTYQWSTGATGDLIWISDPGTYSVTVSNLCGSLADTVEVLILEPPTVDLGPDLDLCEGERVELDASNPNAQTYRWQDGRDKPDRIILDDSGWYSVTVTGKCGMAEDSVFVDYHASPVLDLGADTTLCTGEELVLDGGIGLRDWRWSDGFSGRFRTVRETGWYQVAGENEWGCVGVDGRQVWFESCPAGIYIPNAFSPNGDGLNDRFQIVENGSRLLSYQVFDRWGKLLYMGRSVGDEWDGTFQGEACAEGVYVLKASVEGDHGAVKTFSLSLSLIR